MTRAYLPGYIWSAWEFAGLTRCCTTLTLALLKARYNNTIGLFHSTRLLNVGGRTGRNHAHWTSRAHGFDAPAHGVQRLDVSWGYQTLRSGTGTCPCLKQSQLRARSCHSLGRRIQQYVRFKCSQLGINNSTVVSSWHRQPSCPLASHPRG